MQDGLTLFEEKLEIEDNSNALYFQKASNIAKNVN